ncbi:hypothetical protein N7520_004672 [Penicillium odoratum]|uniref:uncharacterized protein n=1 Tax=Penicillium odoratum TaxID=1167516 RepID=UPI0025480F30|nr:uncharacterized protein N7520_004672 [Penicillium odoratum]KAJ5765113.1 hypothetical protein N7520_004672 [Penicillium odoratum]
MKYYPGPGMHHVTNNEFVRVDDKDVGKWCVMKLSDNRLYWFYGEGGKPIHYVRKYANNLDLSYKGFVETWSRDYHIFESNRDFDEGRCDASSHNTD